MNKKKITILFIIIISITFCIHFSLTATANNSSVDCENSQPVPNLPGNSNYCPMIESLKFDPTNPIEIEAEESIEINVLDGMGPFTWGDPGNGYTWANGTVINPEHPKIKTTSERSNTLQCASGT